jgi:hypothetical protein
MSAALARRVLRAWCVVCSALIPCALPALADSLEQAKRIHDRLAGVPAAPAVLTAMQGLIDANNEIGAANVAMQNAAFYNVTLKNWAAPWTNRDDDKFAALNDYSATVIGLVRDAADYRQVLYGDVIYVGANGVVGAAYSNNDNQHYQQLEAAGVDLGDAAVLVQRAQSTVTGLASTATAGVMTSRAGARAFFIDGTNRAMFRFTLKNHLCYDLEQVQDASRPADRIRQDISRSPGGDSRLFLNNCVSCHAGMDPLAQAFAHYDFYYAPGQPEDSGRLLYRSGELDPATGTQAKYHINAGNFRPGYVTADERWDNYWRDGPNTAIFGWDAGLPGSGSGAKSLGVELAHSRAFAVCAVKKVFKAVCLREPAAADRNTALHGIGGIDAMLGDFLGSGNLKQTFAQAAAYCSGS